MIKVCIKRSVTVLMMTFLVLFAGTLAYNNMELEMTPSVDMPIAMVSCSYTGAGPEEMEDLVTKPIEEALATITGVDTITSSTSTGSSRVMVEFVDGTDIDVAVNDMREKIDQVSGRLPDDADEPTISKMDMNATTITVGITSDTYDVDTLYNLLDANVTADFEKIEGISSVSLAGGTDTEIRVIVDQNKLDNYGITMDTIASAISAENNNVPSGELLQGSIDITLRTIGEFDSIEDIKNTFVTTSGGNYILVKDVAEVVETKKDRDSRALINGEEGCSYSLSKQSDANIVTVTNSVVETISQLEAEYPEMEFTLLTDTAEYIQTSIDNMVSTAYQAAIMAVVILLIMLRSVKLAIVIGISVPTSIFATFGLMYVTGMTLNMMSLGGVVIAIGMLVDNSTVVLEDIYKKRELGMSPSQAAYEGTKEVALAIFASTLTTVAVFLPLTFMSGTMGTLMKEISYTVVYALGASYVVAVTFVPMAAAALMRREDEGKVKKTTGIIYKITHFFDVVVGTALDKLDYGYSRLIAMCLNHRLRVCVIVVAIFLASVVGASQIEADLMSSTDEGSISVSISLPNGTTYDKTNEYMELVLESIGEIPEMEKMNSRIMDGEISITYDVGDVEDRERSTEEIANEIESKLQNIAGCEITVDSSGSSMGSLSGGGFDIMIKGNDNDTLKEVVNELMDLLEQIPNAKDIESSMDDATIEANIVINRAKASQYGLTTSSIASAVSAANSGTVASEFRQDGTEIDIRIMYPEDEIQYIKDLNNLTITNSAGVVIPLTEVASIEMDEAAQTITRENQQTYLEITGSIDGLSSSAQQAEVQAVLDNYVFPDGCSYEFGGMMQTMNDTFSELFNVLIVAVILVYIVMASQFESFVYPFILMFEMPIAVTGGLLGLIITGQTLTSTGYMGLIMLVGTIVNNGIVLVDYTNQLLEADPNLQVDDALVAAGRSRLRPILMTTLTTVIGMLPVAFAWGSGMETNQAMGTVIVFGLTVGTIITLVFIPVLYSIVNSIKNRTRKRHTRVVSSRDESKKKRKDSKKAFKKGVVTNE